MAYYAVIFTSTLAANTVGYGQMAEAMDELARQQTGFLGIESVRGEDGRGITVSYWESLEAIARWKQNPAHLAAQSRGKSEWYREYQVQIAKVDGPWPKAK